jgi:[ribosomal protein S18]-alanine N-acetyltransferase
VVPEAQGRGIGRALFDRAKEEAVGLGARAILVETSPGPSRALDLYRRLGFAEVARCPDYWEDGADLLLLRLRL